jgi:hypothetical protein
VHGKFYSWPADSQGPKPAGIYLGHDPSGWNADDLIIAYADLTVLFTEFARRAEQNGTGLREFLQEQALASIEEDDLPAVPGNSTGLDDPDNS